MLNSQRVRTLPIKTSKATPTAGRSLRKTYGFDTFCINVNSACVKSRLPSLKRGPQKALVLFKERLGLRGPSQMARRLRQAGGRGLRRLRQGCGGPAAPPLGTAPKGVQTGTRTSIRRVRRWADKRARYGHGEMLSGFRKEGHPDTRNETTKPRRSRRDGPRACTRRSPRIHGAERGAAALGRGWGMRSGKTLKLKGWTGRRPHGCPRLDGHSRAASTPPRQTGETDSAGDERGQPKGSFRTCGAALATEPGRALRLGVTGTVSPTPAPPFAPGVPTALPSPGLVPTANDLKSPDGS